MKFKSYKLDTKLNMFEPEKFNYEFIDEIDLGKFKLKHVGFGIYVPDKIVNVEFRGRFNECIGETFEKILNQNRDIDFIICTKQRKNADKGNYNNKNKDNKSYIAFAVSKEQKIFMCEWFLRVGPISFIEKLVNKNAAANLCYFIEDNKLNKDEFEFSYRNYNYDDFCDEDTTNKDTNSEDIANEDTTINNYRLGFIFNPEKYGEIDGYKKFILVNGYVGSYVGGGVYSFNYPDKIRIHNKEYDKDLLGIEKRNFEKPFPYVHSTFMYYVLDDKAINIFEKFVGNYYALANENWGGGSICCLCGYYIKYLAFDEYGKDTILKLDKITSLSYVEGDNSDEKVINEENNEKNSEENNEEFNRENDIESADSLDDLEFNYLSQEEINNLIKENMLIPDENNKDSLDFENSSKNGVFTDDSNMPSNIEFPVEEGAIPLIENYEWKDEKLTIKLVFRMSFNVLCKKAYVYNDKLCIWYDNTAYGIKETRNKTRMDDQISGTLGETAVYNRIDIPLEIIDSVSAYLKAKTGDGLDTSFEVVLLENDMQDLKKLIGEEAYLSLCNIKELFINND